MRRKNSFACISAGSLAGSGRFGYLFKYKLMEKTTHAKRPTSQNFNHRKWAIRSRPGVANSIIRGLRHVRRSGKRGLSSRACQFHPPRIMTTRTWPTETYIEPITPNSGKIIAASTPTRCFPDHGAARRAQHGHGACRKRRCCNATTCSSSGQFTRRSMRAEDRKRI